jgi:small GTP-binding protein
MSSTAEDYNAYRITPTKTINVLFVGRSGTGKTTLINALSDEGFQVTSTTGYSDTKEPSCTQHILTDSKNKILYQMNILDTPGLQEHRVSQNENRSDDTLLNLGYRCIQNNITSLNVVCFVTKAGETYEHDVAVFNKIKDYLGPNCARISMIILTHAEQLPVERINEYVIQLKTHAVTKPLADYCRRGIFGHGTINADHVADFEDDVKIIFIEAKKKKIAPMRNRLIEEMIKCADTPVPITQLVEYQKQIDELRQRFFKEGAENYKKNNDKCCLM